MRYRIRLSRGRYYPEARWFFVWLGLPAPYSGGLFTQNEAHVCILHDQRERALVKIPDKIVYETKS